MKKAIIAFAALAAMAAFAASTDFNAPAITDAAILEFMRREIDTNPGTRAKFHGGLDTQIVSTNDNKIVRFDVYKDGYVYTNASVKVSVRTNPEDKPTDKLPAKAWEILAARRIAAREAAAARREARRAADAVKRQEAAIEAAEAAKDGETK